MIGFKRYYGQDNWAILLCSSRYYFNYRHFVNTLSVYKALKASGYTDEKIILLNSQVDVLGNSRNPLPHKIKSNIGVTFFNDSQFSIDVDYIGEEVTVEAFLRLLIDRVSNTNISLKRLNSNHKSNIFIYMTGHGGDEFFKFQDNEELSAQELGFAFEEMKSKDRYNQVLIMIDTCQASTMCNYITSPNIVCVGSSQKGENSYSYLPDSELGLPLMDRYTYLLSDYILKYSNTKSFKEISIKQLIDSFDLQFVQSNPVIFRSPGTLPVNKIKFSDFFPLDTNYLITKDSPYIFDSIFN